MKIVAKQKNFETKYFLCCRQGCESGSGLDPYSIGSVDPDPDQGGQKLPTKVDNNL